LLQEMIVTIGRKDKRQDSIDRELFERDDEYKHEKLRRMEQMNDIKAAKARTDRLRALAETAAIIKKHKPEKSFDECMEEAKRAERILDDDM
jgi:hypothetical protein